MSATLPRASRGRLTLVTTFFVLAVALPPVVIILLGFLGPPPYLLDRQALSPFADKIRLYQGAEVETEVFEDQSSAKAAARRYADTTAKRQSVRTLDEQRHVREDNGHYELVNAIDGVVLRIEGPDRKQVDAAFAALPFVVENPEKNLVWVLTTDHLGLFFASLGIYVLVILVLATRGMSWAGRIDSAKGSVAAPVDVLRRRLLAFSDSNIPFEIREGRNGRLVAEWRLADARWTGVLEKGGLRHRHTLVIELEPSTSVARVLQTIRTLRWYSGVPRSGLSFSSTRSIADFRWESGSAYGLLRTSEGWRFSETYRYRYQIGEIAQPLVATILDAGWSFRPVYTFFRPLGG